MRRSLAYIRRMPSGRVRFAIARHPADPPAPDDHSAPTAKFEPATTRRGWTMSFNPKVRGKAHTSKIPAHIKVGNEGFILKHGKADGVRLMPPEVIEALDLLDEEWKAATVEFRRKWNDLIEDGYARGRTLRREDVEPENAPCLP